MRYFYDTEFIEDGRTIDLISIGVVCEDGREFYAQNADCRLEEASEWVRENVLPHLREFQIDGFKKLDTTDASSWRLPYEIRDELLIFVGDDKPEFWGYYSAYDHVALCQLFGTMMDLPKGWPFYTRDLRQLADEAGVDLSKEVPQQSEHHALADANWNKAAWDWLRQHDPRRIPLLREAVA